MQHFLYLILKSYVRPSIYWYFSSIKEYGKENLRGTGPFLFVANHQNAFMDGVVMVAVNTFPVHFLIRADIFKNKLAARILKFLKLIPVYRIRDGWGNLEKNHDQFDECIRLFKLGESVLIFPEGNHAETRRLRPLSKGFTRIAFEALRQHPDLNLRVVPVGINYGHHRAFNKPLSLHYGKPIDIREFMKEPLPQYANQFKDEVDRQIRARVCDIPEANYEVNLKKLVATNPDFSNLEDTRNRVAKIERGEAVAKTVKKAPWLYKLGLPLLPLAYLINFPLVLGWRKFKGVIKDPAFTTSMKYGFGFLVAQIYFILLMGIGAYFVGWWALFVYPLCLVLLKLFRPSHR